MNYIEKFNLMEETINTMKLALKDSDVNINEAKDNLMRILNDYDRKIVLYEKKLAEVSLFHKQQLENEIKLSGQTIKELNEKLKAFEFLENMVDVLKQGGIPITALSKKWKDAILLAGETITRTGYYINKNKSWRDRF